MLALFPNIPFLVVYNNLWQKYFVNIQPINNNKDNKIINTNKIRIIMIIQT